MLSRFVRLFAVTLVLATLPVCARAQGDPFNAGSLSTALKGMRAYKAKMGDAAALTSQYLANQKKISSLEESSKRQIDDYHANYNKIDECQHASNDMQSPERQAQMQKKVMALMGDPAAYQKFAAEQARLGQVMATAMSKGDTVAAKKAQNDIMKLIGVDSKADSLAAVAKCGALPARPAVLDQIDQMEKQDQDLSSRIRMSESSADIEGARAAGVAPATFAQMRERLGLFVTNGKAFQGSEGDLLRSHQSEIEGLVKTI